MTKTLISALAAAILLGACAAKFTKLTDGGEKVRVLDPAEVSTCKNLGRTHVAVTPRIIFERSEESVAKDLATQARNVAADSMGGDTVVPLTVINEGKQTFVVYKCVNPDG